MPRSKSFWRRSPASTAVATSSDTTRRSPGWRPGGLYADGNSLQAAAAPVAIFAPNSPHQQQLLVATAIVQLLKDDWRSALTSLDAALDRAEQTHDEQLIAVLGNELHPLFALMPGGVSRFERLLQLVERTLEPERAAQTGNRLPLCVATWPGRLDEAHGLAHALADDLACNDTLV